MNHRSTTAARFALTGVALAAACLWSVPSWALGLGRLEVQSALGEPLRAEIDVTALSAEEAATLQLRIASPEAFRAAGVDYNAILSDAQLTLQRRPDGRQVLRLSGGRTVVEPFVDIIVEAGWASGRLVREYTMLFDPPGHRVAAAPPAAPTAAPVITPAPPRAPVVTAPVAPPAPVAVAPVAPPPAVVPPAPPRPSRAERPAERAPVDARGARVATPERVQVRRGDTLYRIATRTQPAGVSLDQMLVALFRGNPDAFIGDNMNRLKSGAVLTVPAAGAAERVAPAQAREIIQAQAADFSAYRQRLAAGTEAVAAEQPRRQATGQVQASVDDRRRDAAPTPDKLTLSQGSVQASAAAGRASQEAERQAADARLAELARNVEELKRLQGAASAPAQAAEPAPAVPPAASEPAAPLAVEATPPLVASAPEAASAPAAASEPAAAAPPVPAPPELPSDSADDGFLASLLDDPLLLSGAGVLAALLAGLLIYRMRKGRAEAASETSFLESRLQPDSFFGSTGGQRVDTREGTPSGAPSSTMNYSLSQLDAIGDVDPVAEADVYLAYGRDLQAEEILKEAMRANPERLAIRMKLLEVYQKRRDTKAFELLATQVYAMTQGSGDDWAQAQAGGRQIDPENPLYQPGGAPALEVGPGGRVVEPLGATTLPHAAKPSEFGSGSTLPPPVTEPPPAVDLELDIDLDAPSPAPSPIEQTRPMPRDAMPSDHAPLDFELPLADTRPGALAPAVPAAPATRAAATPPASDFGALDFDLGDFRPTQPPLQEAPAADVPLSFDVPSEFAPSRPRADEPALDFSEFGLGPDTLPGGDADPLARKLELAEEFRQIGDLEGARDLLEEVVAKADGALRIKAQGMLDSLDR